MRSHLLVMMFLIVACQRNEQQLYYSFYGKNDSLIEKNKYVQVSQSKSANQWLVHLSGKDYNESFTMKLDSSGLFRLCNTNFLATHHFDSVQNEAFCKSSPPFLNKNVSWIKKQRYVIEGSPYDLFCYSENSGSEISYSSYYLKGLGFLCYYNYQEDKYILCDSISGVNFDLQILRKLGDVLIHDSTTFEKYVVKRPPKVIFTPPKNDSGLN